MIKYIGNGWLKGVPARDLTDEDIEALGLDAKALVKSGVYKTASRRVTPTSHPTPASPSGTDVDVGASQGREEDAPARLDKSNKETEK